MRITNNMISYNFLTSLNKSLERQNKIQEQLSDGKAIHRASDDPIKTIRSLRFNTNLAQNEQYTQNVKDALSWMETTDGVMSDLGSIMISIKEKVIQASTGSNPESAVQTIGSEVDKLLDHIITLGNTKIGDRYIFSGQNDKMAPFTRTGDTVTYHGDINKISMPIQPGIVDPNKDSVNLTGYELFGSKLSIINHVIEIKDHLTAGTADDQKWLSETGLQYLEDDHSQILQAQTEIGGRYSMYEMSQSMMEDNYTTITGDLSANEDLDIPKAIIDFKTSENVYKMALSVGASIMPPSLVDFLK
ncbi:MAG: flagellar hook-associated protein FlgL [Negativicutes bacterium]|nr:flagellar hook-associated protein FlgL [Negativicutes bacterium]